jgi:hypothetical protein
MAKNKIKISLSTEAPGSNTIPVTQEKVIAAFESNKKIIDGKIKFAPEVKVKRETDNLYISEMRKTKVGYVVTVEVFHPQRGSDKAPMPLGMLDSRSLLGIYLRLNW